MSAHTQSSTASRSLCDALFQALSNKIHGLQRSEAQSCCGYYQKNKKRFVYIYHRKTSARLEVWILGEVTKKSDYPSLIIRPRNPTTGGFGAEFESRFYLERTSQLSDAIALLYNISYRAS